MSDQDDRWHLVGKAVTDRMLQLGLSQADLARITGLSAITIRPFMHGQRSNSRPATTARIARALGWPPDAIRQILDGVDPAELGTAPPDDDPPASDALADPDVMGIAALAGEMTPAQRARVEAYMRGLLDSDGT